MTMLPTRLNKLIITPILERKRIECKADRMRALGYIYCSECIICLTYRCIDPIYRRFPSGVIGVGEIEEISIGNHMKQHFVRLIGNNLYGCAID